MVKGAVAGDLGSWLACGVFEEEDHAVYGTWCLLAMGLGCGRSQGSLPLLPQEVGVECDELFELHVLDAEVIDEVGEDTLG